MLVADFQNLLLEQVDKTEDEMICARVKNHTISHSCGPNQQQTPNAPPEITCGICHFTALDLCSEIIHGDTSGYKGLVHRFCATILHTVSHHSMIFYCIN